MNMSFWAMPWIGELAPDDATGFASDGNLATTRFHHELRETATLGNLPVGTSFAYPSGSLAAHDGSASLLQSDTSDGGPFIALAQHASPASTSVQPKLRVLRDEEDLCRDYYPVHRFSVFGHDELEPSLDELPESWAQDYIVFRRR